MSNISYIAIYHMVERFRWCTSVSDIAL